MVFSRIILKSNLSYLLTKYNQPLVLNCKSFQRTYCKRSRMSKSALVILAQGAEEMETVITVDMLRRAGVAVTMAGLDGSDPVLCSRQITLVPDKSLADARAENPEYDAIILPGGLEGADRLAKSSVVGDILRAQEKDNKIIAAICAAPTVFVAHGVAKNKKVTSYPTTKDKIPADQYTYVEGSRVVVDGHVVTSRGPGTAYWFGLTLIELLKGKEEADKVEKGMIISCY
ncbi:hypothetical protein PYW07_011473 [Mythimna separata]|uniref:DJ-1/PfpI domain-containing protein n=1 Tax=Mythimna separata TaxID=271217 RepID=A0AAD7Y9H6_MYTSE|nr:hypothetical protein PYW07_011473 [Mythimna separata]